MLYDEHNRCTFNDLPYAAIDSIDLLIPNMRVTCMCRMSLPVCIITVELQWLEH